MPRVNTPQRPANPQARGFSLIEVMIVVAIIAILALMAVPSLQNKYIRENIIEAMPLAKIAKDPIAAAWAATKTLPEDNAAAGLPAPDKIVSNVVKSVTVENGAIHIVFGNRANGRAARQDADAAPGRDRRCAGRARPPGCAARARAPENMRAMGTDKTDVPGVYLPVNCL